MTIRFRRASSGRLQAYKAGLVERLKAEWDVPVVHEDEMSYGSEKGILSDAALHFFMVVATNWFRCAITDMYEAAGKTSEEGVKYCDELVRAKLVRICHAKTFNRGGQIKFILPTEAGLEKLRNAGARFMEIRGDVAGDTGDQTHVWYQNRIAQELSAQGWATEIEQILKKKRVDVGAILDGGKAMHAYEIVNVDIKKELKNLIGDLEDGWYRVVFVVGTPWVKNELEKLIESELGIGILEKVDYRVIYDRYAARKKDKK